MRNDKKSVRKGAVITSASCFLFLSLSVRLPVIRRLPFTRSSALSSGLIDSLGFRPGFNGQAHWFLSGE